MQLLRWATLSDWPSRERDTVIGSALALFGGFLLNSSWGLVILPIQQTFSSGVDGEVLLRQLPDVAALLAVPAVGAFGARFRAGHIASCAAAVLLVGAVLMVVAPSLAWLVVGAGLTSIARAMVGVLAFAAVGAVVLDESRRSSAFALLGATAPAAYILGPLLASALLGAGGWRLVGVVWLASACVMVAAARWLRGPDMQRTAGGHKEPWTPILAGITLVGIVQMLGAITLHGPLSAIALGWSAGTIIAASAWFVLASQLSKPSLDGRTLLVPGLVPILIVAMLAQCGDLWFYVGAIARFVHRLTPLQVSLALLAAQIASLVGACLAGWLVRHVGLRRSGTALLALFAAAMFLSCTQSLELPLWTAVAILCVSAVAELGVGVCVSQAVMSCAPKGLDGPVSSYRSAATGVGNALALLLVATTVGHTMGESIRQQAQERGASPDKVEALVQAVRENVPSAVIGRQLELRPERVEDLRQTRQEVMMDGFRTHGLVSGVVLSVAAVGFWFVRRDPSLSNASG